MDVLNPSTASDAPTMMDTTTTPTDSVVLPIPMDTTLDIPTTADVPFSDKKVSKKILHNINQIMYSLLPYKGNDQHNFIKVYACNNLAPKSLDNPYPWRTMPATYTSPLLRAFF